MADLKITDLPDGIRFKTGDMVLAERDGKPISLPGSVFMSANDYNPPLAAGFPNAAWGGSATQGLTLSDAPRGLLISDLSGDDGGSVKLASRPIPEAQRGAFIFTAKVSYQPTYGSRSGIGIGVSSGGQSTKILLLTRWGTSQTNLYGGPYLHYNDKGVGEKLTDDALVPLSTFKWMRIQVTGTVASAFISDEGVNWVLLGSKDFGETITEYGFSTISYMPGIGTGLCEYFDSTEFPFTRF